MDISMCGVVGCYDVSEARPKNVECPRCGITSAEIIAFRTNDRDAINSKKIDLELDNIYNDALGG